MRSVIGATHSLARTIRGASQANGALHFTANDPLPEPLLKRLLDARMPEDEATASAPLPRAKRKK
ncbi:MAG: hypothetical protein RL199_1525 [Pseudomonadota bacterium]|jgi:hypothetical protein